MVLETLQHVNSVSMTEKKPAVSYKGNEWDVTGSQHRHKEAADFCAWYFWAGIFSHISLMNKMVGCAEKKKTATKSRKQPVDCARTEKPNCRLLPSPLPHLNTVVGLTLKWASLSSPFTQFPAQEKQNNALGKGGILVGGMKKCRSGLTYCEFSNFLTYLCPAQLSVPFTHRG